MLTDLWAALLSNWKELDSLCRILTWPRQKLLFFGDSHIGAGDNNVSNHSEPYDKDNILHRLFSLEKIVEMPKSCCVKNCSNSTKNNENVRFYLLPKENVRRKLRNAIRQVCLDKDGNIDNKRIWLLKSLHVYVCSEHFIAGKFILIDI